ncbi:BZ3500_MvSof-1268-A1-R1_Chr3-1g05925 [Microbotryum saponariae]|uniref:BZ3500_MvSof-1268-A1-R1_Chr3-1g05925 protein n=1 Tax=Microbotryum saponariae TaxID=289078 RepID=A0A2X0LSL3_9BASI|nr:BZ3500_MvSof-1268-A1-R1_Chr3-1g05925 [Microbotryum saponariae]SDA05115.1 BZ3501_MvSof-1269-A2-R1_Chr3-1g05595 [Microbotryum saponariae]
MNETTSTGMFDLDLERQDARQNATQRPYDRDDRGDEWSDTRHRARAAAAVAPSPTAASLPQTFDPFAPLPPSHIDQTWSAATVDLASSTASTSSSPSALGSSVSSHASHPLLDTPTTSKTTSSTRTSPSASPRASPVPLQDHAKYTPNVSNSAILGSNTPSLGPGAGASEGPAGNGNATGGGGTSGRGRPSSLYIPMDDDRPMGLGGNGFSDHSGQTSSTWPFGNGSHYVSSPPSEPYPMTPSAIHPSYADIDARVSSGSGSLAPANSHSTPSSNGFVAAAAAASSAAFASITGTKEHLYSAIPVAAASPDRNARSSSPMRNAQNGKHQVTFSSSISTSKGANITGPRHAPTFSVGTHSLLASRSGSTTSRLAQRLDSSTHRFEAGPIAPTGLTLFNKLVLQGFPFPWTLTAIQMLSGTIGTQIALFQGYFTQARLTTREGLVMIAFSVLYTVNIAVSNISLGLVTVPFHQVVRAMTPLFTIIIAAVLHGKRHSRDTYLSLLPVVAGVAFATYGDYSFTAWGFILTLLGTLLAALKTITTNRVQVGRLKLHPLDLLIRMSPLAFVQCVVAGYLSGELDKVRIYGATEMTRHKAIALATNGAIAFGLNVVSFTANKKTSALTMTVAANVKQVLTIGLAVLIFNVTLNLMNVFGIILTLGGGAWYAFVEFKEKNNRNNNAIQPPTRSGQAEMEKL